MFPRQIVPMMARKIRPVGIEMSSVVSMNGPSNAGAHPLTNMWCAHTMMLSATIAMIPTTAIR